MPQRIAPFNFDTLDPPPLKSVPEQKDLTAKPGGILPAELFYAAGCAAADETK